MSTTNDTPQNPRDVDKVIETANAYHLLLVRNVDAADSVFIKKGGTIIRKLIPYSDASGRVDAIEVRPPEISALLSKSEHNTQTSITFIPIFDRKTMKPALDADEAKAWLQSDEGQAYLTDRVISHAIIQLTYEWIRSAV